MSTPPLRWAVLGMGQAGSSRLEAIRRDPRSEVVAVWRGKFAASAGVPVTDSAEDAIGLADAVYVCSPLDVHAEQIELALSAGKHVASEYPMATDSLEARALFALAESRGVVLHVGHIELLSGTARTLSAHVHPSDIQNVELFFSCSGARLPGSALAFRNIARLHRLTDAAGPIKEIVEVEHGDGELMAVLKMETGRPVNIGFRQGPGLPRHTILEIRTYRERWRQVDRDLFLNGSAATVLDQGSVFAQDHRVAVRRILDGDPGYLTEARIIKVLELAQRLRSGQTGAL